MCKDCGCLTATHPIFSLAPSVHSHDHFHAHDHSHDHAMPFSPDPQTSSRKIRVEETLFAQNQRYAEQNRQFFKRQNLCVFNFMSSPGSGKTTLLSSVLPALAKKHPLAVIVGDQETDIDASRLRDAGLNSFQINTHSACHLDAHRIGHAIEQLPLQTLDWIVIENVGNLVCPAVFDLGENFKVALLSTPEGEEKPLKYPVLFHDADLIVITKSDLIPYLEYKTDVLMQNIRTLNSKAPVIFCSVKTKQGLDNVAAALETLQPNPGDHRVPRTASPDHQP